MPGADACVHLYRPQAYRAAGGTVTNFSLAFRFIFANNERMAITRRQREVYDFISRFVTENGYSPSFEEIGQGLKLNSLATVHKHITNLEKKGLLTRDYNRSRSIDLLPPKGKPETIDEREHWRGIAADRTHCCRSADRGCTESGDDFAGGFRPIEGSVRSRSAWRFDAG